MLPQSLVIATPSKLVLRALQIAEQQRLDRIQDHGGAANILAQIRNNYVEIDGKEADLMNQAQPVVPSMRSASLPKHTFGSTSEDWDPARDMQPLRGLLAIEGVQKKALGLIAEFNRSRPGLVPLTLEEALSGNYPDEKTAVKVEELLAAHISTSQGLLDSLRSFVPARAHQEELRRKFAGLGYDPTEGSRQTFWLVILSLCVCVVGIVNSMMMAVTERFREIATMKCLGAMDSFIVKSFMLESGGVGTVGALIGGILGALLAITQSWLAYSGTFWSAFPLAEFGGAIAVAVFAGLLLTIIGALAPAMIASRMHPMDAMRLKPNPESLTLKAPLITIIVS